MQNAQRLSNFSSLSSILSMSPQTITEPVSYTVDNLAPFDVPVYSISISASRHLTYLYTYHSAEAVVFVGLIYQIIVSFFIVVRFLFLTNFSITEKITYRQMVGYNARAISGLEKSLSTYSLIALRFGSTFSSLFIVSVYSNGS